MLSFIMEIPNIQWPGKYGTQGIGVEKFRKSAKHYSSILYCLDAVSKNCQTFEIDMTIRNMVLRCHRITGSSL